MAGEMLEKIKLDIVLLHSNLWPPEEGYYEIHCSPNFLEQFSTEICNRPIVNLPTYNGAWVLFIVPGIGYLKFYHDLEEGFKIKEINGQ